MARNGRHHTYVIRYSYFFLPIFMNTAALKKATAVGILAVSMLSPYFAFAQSSAPTAKTRTTSSIADTTGMSSSKMIKCDDRTANGALDRQHPPLVSPLMRMIAPTFFNLDVPAESEQT